MAWNTDRKSRLPANWRQIRAAVLKRDRYLCQIRGPRCIGAANQCDHIERGDNNAMSNLQAACQPCHSMKTGMEAAASKPKRRRTPEQHPGLL